MVVLRVACYISLWNAALFTFYVQPMGTERVLVFNRDLFWRRLRTEKYRRVIGSFRKFFVGYQRPACRMEVYHAIIVDPTSHQSV